MAKQKMKQIENRFFLRENFLSDEAFEENIQDKFQCYTNQYIGCSVEIHRNEHGARVIVRESPAMAERRELIKELFYQLNEYVPNWRRSLKDRTAKQLEEFYNEAFEKVNFENVWNYIQHNKEGLQLKKREVSDGLWFALILFGIYGREKFGYADWNDKKIFDVSDDEIDKKLTSIEDLLKIRRNGLVFNLRKDYFFERIVEIREFLDLLEKTDF